MKKLLFFLLILFSFSLVCAHQPRYVMNQNNILVNNPEISQAFYAELQGESDYYSINSNKPFELYVNILAPESGNTNFKVIISKENETLESAIILNGENHSWNKFYEEFAGDTYLRGPEFEKNVSEGKYLIKVFNENNTGKYSLAIGKLEVFSIKDLFSLFRIKHDFFGKSYFAFFQGIIGKSILFLILVFILIILIIYKIIKKKKRSRKK